MSNSASLCLYLFASKAHVVFMLRLQRTNTFWRISPVWSLLALKLCSVFCIPTLCGRQYFSTLVTWHHPSERLRDALMFRQIDSMCFCSWVDKLPDNSSSFQVRRPTTALDLFTALCLPETHVAPVCDVISVWTSWTCKTVIVTNVNLTLFPSWNPRWDRRECFVGRMRPPFKEQWPPLSVWEAVIFALGLNNCRTERAYVDSERCTVQKKARVAAHKSQTDHYLGVVSIGWVIWVSKESISIVCVCVCSLWAVFPLFITGAI